uniref:Uncharacterized protein n=1 Tax=Arundo donax TaxID=35708 RepID=A0A0A9EGU6_ARUDO
MSTVQIMILISFDTIKFQFTVSDVACSTDAIDRRKLQYSECQIVFLLVQNLNMVCTYMCRWCLQLFSGVPWCP